MKIQMDYCLNATFDRYSKLLKERFVYKFYPEIELLFPHFINILTSSSKHFDNVFIDFFEIPITTGTESDNYYLNWNVDLINKHVDDNLDKAVNVQIGASNIFSCDSKLIKWKLEYYKSTNIERPIVLAYHLPIEKWIVIDGNHRYHAAKQNKEQTIKAIILPPSVHINFMLNDVSKKLYIVHHNLHFLLNFSLNPLRDNTVSSSNLDLLEFNNSLNESCNFSLIKNVKLYAFQKILGNFKKDHQ